MGSAMGKRLHYGVNLGRYGNSGINEFHRLDISWRNGGRRYLVCCRYCDMVFSNGSLDVFVHRIYQRCDIWHRVLPLPWMPTGLALPFGPFLAIAGIIVVWLGEQMSEYCEIFIG